VKIKTYYRFNFYLNARHSVIFDGKASNVHPHTWEVVVKFGLETTEIINFTYFERELEKYFLNYEGKYLNELTSFNNSNPTMENIGKVLYEDIKRLINNRNMYFSTLEISENPTRTYIIQAE
jgi:6-pyruvoyltetrahydropterin/6-carboxytetrahydropterin synthase